MSKTDVVVEDARHMVDQVRSELGTPTAATIVAYSSDVFFGMRIRTVVTKLGYAAQTVNDAAEFVRRMTSEGTASVLGLVDFNQPVDWEELAPAVASGVPIVAFGSHTDVEGFRAAKAAGVARVVSNGDLSRSLPDLVARYARA